MFKAAGTLIVSGQAESSQIESQMQHVLFLSVNSSESKVLILEFKLGCSRSAIVLVML